MKEPTTENKVLDMSAERSLSKEEIVSRIENLDRIIESKDILLAQMQPYVIELMATRHKEFKLEDSHFDSNQDIAAQLYEEPTYNGTFIHGSVKIEGKARPNWGDLDARRGAEYSAVEDYDEGKYAQATLKAARALGYVAPDLPLAPTNEVDARLGIANSYLEPIGEEIEAVIIPTAKSISNPMRIRDALRNIESGKIRTNKIIIASCDREVDDDERAKLDALGLSYGKTEFSSAVASFNELTGSDINPTDAEPFSVEVNGVMREGKKLVKKVELPFGDIELVVVSAPFDPTHQTGFNKETGEPMFATRANTQQNLLAANEFLSTKPGLIALESHDVWTKSQAEIADQVLGPVGKRTVPTGPFKLDRLRVDEEGRLILNRPGEVIDEIAKTYSFAAKTRVIALNAREKLVQTLD